MQITKDEWKGISDLKTNNNRLLNDQFLINTKHWDAKDYKNAVIKMKENVIEDFLKRGV